MYHKKIVHLTTISRFFAIVLSNFCKWNDNNQLTVNNLSPVNFFNEVNAVNAVNLQP